MKYILIYGSKQHTLPLIEEANAAALRAFRLVATGCAILVADRYGVEAEAMRTCQIFRIPLLVVGTTVRPRSGVSVRYYERAVVSGNKEHELDHYLAQKATGVLVIGDTPDCRAMQLHAVALHKNIRQRTITKE